MIEAETRAAIFQATAEYWEKHVREEAFATMAKGKEVGHRIADLVDERTTSLLQTRFDTKFQHSTAGAVRSRSMGDIWLKSGGIYNPINVKTGIADNVGQPNMVSMKKLLCALASNEIDSYYLLILKLTAGDPLGCKVYLVDMLDYLPFVTFDSGPGQVMLRAQKFFSQVEAGWLPTVQSVRQKIETLFALMKDGEDRLIRNREKGLKQMTKLIEGSLTETGPVFDQSGLNLR